jgi:hypothetical protein
MNRIVDYKWIKTRPAYKSLEAEMDSISDPVKLMIVKAMMDVCKF